MFVQKNPRKKRPRKTFWIAPAFTLTAVALLLILFSTAKPSHGQTVGDTQVTLTCNDGHSVIFEVDQITLTSVLADVQAINVSGTGTSCTLDTAAIDPSSETTEWTVYDYNPSNRAIAPRNSANSMPATTSGNTTMFQFLPSTYTALLTTKDPSLTGDVSGKTLNASVSVSGSMTGTFMYQNGGGCVYPANVRFYFTSPKASGTTGPGTTGFYTQFWWSNPANVQLLTESQGPTPISAIVSDPNEWSDWNGKRGSDSLEVMAAFQVAIQNVQTVGLSFGGGCFFENGVTTSDGSGTFNSTFTETP
jgi:hypothetical protein